MKKLLRVCNVGFHASVNFRMEYVVQFIYWLLLILI